jgi:hypothetical protein
MDDCGLTHTADKKRIRTSTLATGFNLHGMKDVVALRNSFAEHCFREMTESCGLKVLDLHSCTGVIHVTPTMN